ncbi:type VI secretion system baseplate subunit TssE [Microvirga massiliensis]|uniref:type VI secretion system baseplate subunit TssE n=1 Tax=Microvirga massiliensis TaxID=1033741 RepID=UPI000B006AC2
MAGSTLKDRVSPPLMHAFRAAFTARDSRTKLDLRNEQGERVIASRRASHRSAITEPVLRREVARDLEALLNTIALESTQDLSEFEDVRRSVLNFGLPDVVHRSIDEAAVQSIPAEIEAALVRYEPRLVPQSIIVGRDDSIDPKQLKVRFTVRADLSCDPVNVPVEFVADVEFDTGKIVINRL